MSFEVRRFTISVTSRFIFVLLGPPGSQTTFHEIGRSMATLMSDEVFHEVAYRARKREHLLAGIDEFLDAVTVLPPGEWDPAIRIEPPAAIPSQEDRKRPPSEKQPKKEEPDEEEEEARQREESGLSRSGRLFGGLINDCKRKTPWYFSDFKDGLNLQSVASWIFLYFACLSPSKLLITIFTHTRHVHTNLNKLQSLPSVACFLKQQTKIWLQWSRLFLALCVAWFMDFVQASLSLFSVQRVLFWFSKPLFSSFVLWSAGTI